MALLRRPAPHVTLPPWLRKVRKVLAFLMPLIIIAFGVYIFYNFPALKQRFGYAIHKPKVGDTRLLPATLRGGGEIPVAPRSDCGGNIPWDKDGNPTKICDNYIYIPKIHVAAPIVNPTSTADATINEFLLKGVVHYPGTAEPGQKGNVFLTGHSSYYWWAPGDFKFVFTLVPELTYNDQIIVYNKGIRYTYNVVEVRTVSPNAVDVLKPTADPVVTLSTCVPVGTANSRRIVRAKQVSPDPSTAKGVTANQTTPTRLPGQR